MSEVLDGIILQIGSVVLGESWLALLTLSALAVGTAKKLEWAARLGLLAFVGVWRAGVWAMTPKPVHPGVKAALAVAGNPDAKVGYRNGATMLSAGRLEVAITGSPSCARERDWSKVTLDGEDQSALFTDAERARIAKAARAEIARRDKAKAARDEADRLRNRDALASLLIEGIPLDGPPLPLRGRSDDKPDHGPCECGAGGVCLCGPSCGCDHCEGCEKCVLPPKPLATAKDRRIPPQGGSGTAPAKWVPQSTGEGSGCG
jgi:hypothetical protein